MYAQKEFNKRKDSNWQLSLNPLTPTAVVLSKKDSLLNFTKQLKGKMLKVKLMACLRKRTQTCQGKWIFLNF